MNHADFNKLYFECRDLLPTSQLKHLFDCALVGGMSSYVPEEHVRRVMVIALDTAQSFKPAIHEQDLHLVKR